MPFYLVKVSVATVSAPNMVTSRTDSAYVTSAGEGICATTQAVRASARTAPAMGSVTAPRTCARAVTAGPETGVTFLTAPVCPTASDGGTAMPLWTRPGARIVPKDGWARHVTIRASMASRSPWTAASVFASRDGSVLAATANVLNGARSLLGNANATAGGVEPTVRIPVVLVTGRIALAMARVTAQLTSVSVIPGGLVMGVTFQTVLAIPTAPAKVC